jgi:hypothetical protein
MTKQSSTTADRSDWEWPGGWLALGIYFGLAALYFLPGFLPGNHLYGSDYLAAGYFSHEYISERLAAGALPKWVPWIYGGLPWFANPGSTFYPFRFVVDILFAPHRIFAAFYVIQFTLAGFGTWLLARELGTRRWVAFVGGLAFMFTGLMMSFVLAGHEGRIIVATFTPLFLFFLHRGVRTGGLAWFAGAALTLGFSLLSFQIQSNYYLLLLGAAWGVFAIVAARVRGAGPVTGRVALGLGAVAAGFLLAAVNFLPFLSYVDASPRGGGGRGYEYATSWDMPPSEISGIALPEHAGVLELYRGDNPFKLHTEYVGGVVVLLLVLGLLYGRRDRYWWFFLGTALVGLSFSFGGHTPIYRLYYELLPGTARFRAPSISFFVVSFALVAMATLTLERVARLRERQDDEALRPLSWIVAGVAGLALLVMLVSGGAEGEHGRAMARGAFRLFLVTALAGAGVWAWAGRRIATPLLAVGLCLVTVADLWSVDRRFFRTVEPPASMMAADDVVDFFRSREEPFRVWVLPAEIQRQQAYAGGLKNYLMRFDIAQVAGEHGNQLQAYNEYLGAGETTYVDWHNFLTDLQGLVDPSAPGGRPSAPFLRAANVRYIVSTIQLPGLPLAYQGRTGLVYEVPDALPRAYLVGDAVTAQAPDGALQVMAAPGFDPRSVAVVYEAPAEGLFAPRTLSGEPVAGTAVIETYEPDRVVVRTTADRPALLVLADNYYPGWEARIDDRAAPVQRANHTFRAVPVPAGEHVVTLRFRPTAFYVGAWISLGTFLALLAVAAVAFLRHRRAHPAPAGPGDGGRGDGGP